MKLHVIRSSAGAGKTYNLIKFFLCWILGNSDPFYFRHLLAITFTNKSTNEMKSRLIRALKGITNADPSYHDLLEELCSVVDMKTSEIRARCNTVLSHILHNYGDLSISTIDRFVFRLIKSFSFELSVPVNVEVELNKDRLEHKILDALYEALGTDEKLEKVLVEFASHKFEGERNTNLDNDLIKIIDEVMSAKADKFLKQIDTLSIEDFLQTKDKVLKHTQNLERTYARKAAELLSWFENHQVEFTDLYQGTRGVYGFLTKLKSGNITMPNNLVRKTLEEGKWISGKCSDEHKELIFSNKDYLDSRLSDLIIHLEQELPHYMFCKTLINSFYSMGIAHEVHRIVTEVKTKTATAQLEDFNLLISKLIKEAPIPFIYERLGEKYHHYLMDEFQDTSEIQWFNILPLIENSLSEGYSSLIVGDAKQAIYRWRGGAAHQLTSLPHLDFAEISSPYLQQVSSTIENAFEPSYLEHNYRSSPVIVTFVNRFFNEVKLKFPDITSDVFEEHEQLVRKDNLSGSVNIRFLSKETSDLDRLEESLEAIQGFSSKGYAFGDMALICRKKEQCSGAAEFLLDSGIPVISSESLELRNSPVVRSLISWFEYLYEGEQLLSAYQILKFIFEKEFGEEGTYKLYDSWRSEDNFEEIIKNLGYSMPLTQNNSLTLFERCCSIISIFYLDSLNDNFVSTFLDHVNAFQNQFGNDMSDFLEWWHESGSELSVEMPEVPNAVNILTAHKSKGLEFDIVITPFMDNEIRNSKSSFWVETVNEDAEILPVAWLPATKSMEQTNYAELYSRERNASVLDTLNLMYVTLTRARKHIFVLSTESGKNSNTRNESSILRLSLNLKDLNNSEAADRFTCGEVDEKAIEEMKQEGIFLNCVEKPGSWHDKLLLEFRSENSLGLENQLSERNRGTLLHELLADLYDTKDMDRLINSLGANEKISAEEVKLVRSDLEEILNDPEIQTYFNDYDGNIITEREMVDRDGNRYRPDRCCINGNSVVVFDYKSGMKKDKDEHQVRQYVELLREIGYENCSGYLLYLSDREVKKVA